MTRSLLNRSDLVHVLARTAQLFLQYMNHNSAELIARHGKVTAEAIAMHEVGRELVSQLSSAEPFLGSAGFMVATPNGYSGFYADEASQALLKRVCSGHTADDALMWLDQLLDTPSASGVSITALWGIDCKTPIDLDHNIQLLPIDRLRDSPTKQRILRSPAWDANTLGSVLPWRHPTMVVTAPSIITPLLYPTSNGSPPQQQDPFRLSNMLDDARLALSLCGPSFPLPAGHWFEFDDPDLRELFRYSGISRQHIEVLPMWMGEPIKVEPDKARSVVSAFLSMKPEEKAVMRLSLGRFNQALRRPSHGDRALELAIALESLLVDNAGENTYKFALRAALLLGGTLEERRATRALVSALYNLRSTLVHNGVLPQTVKVPGEGKRSSIKVVDEATATAGLVLERIVQHGRIPDWNSLELGQPLHP